MHEIDRTNGREDDSMQRVTKPNEIGALAGGWLVKTGQSYYTGNRRSALESWTVFPKFAKVYQRKRWAQTMAERIGGQAVPATALSHEKVNHP
jgi:hypothetical protein